MVLVVIGHYIPESSPDWYKALHGWIYTFHMPLFMFASGYIYIAYKKDENYGRFILKKVRRLMIPYFTTSFIIISIKLLTQKGMYVEHPVGITSYMKMFCLPEAGYYLWFIWALFLLFVFVPLFKGRKERLFLFMVAMFLHYAHPFALTTLFCVRQSVDMSVWFMLGVVAFDWKDKIKGVTGYGPASAILRSLIVAVFVSASLLNSYGSIGGGKIIAAVLPWSGIGCIMLLSTFLVRYKSRRFMKPLLAISHSGYIIYLFHTAFEGFAKSFLHKLPMAGGDGQSVFVAGCCMVAVVGIAGPIFLHKYVLNKSHVTKILFGLK